MIRSWTVLTLVVACGLVLAGCTSDGTDVSPSTSATADGAGVSPATSATALPVGAYVPVGSPGDDSRDGYVLNLGPDGDFFNLMDRNTLRLTPKGVDSCEERARMCSGGFRLFMRDMDFEYEANFGEEFTLGDGIWVTVGEPVQFTPSEEVSAMPFWGPLALEDWDQFVRATVTWRNEFGGVAQTEWVGEEDGQVILDEASGLEELGGTELEEGEEVSYDVGFGVTDPADVQVNVSLINSGGWNGQPECSASVTFTS